MIALAIVAQVIRIAVPYLFAAAGGVLSERSGLIALTLEGFLTIGAFAGAVGTLYAHDNPWVGVVCGIVAGAALAGVYAIATIRFKANQVIAGIALNLLVAGGCAFFLRLAFNSSANSPRVAAIGDGAGAGILGSLANPLVWGALLVLPGVWWLLYRTAFGLRVRAVGEHPDAARSLGVSVPRIQYIAVILAGALTGLGGVYLAFDQHKFTDGMTAGRGFIALAAVIFGRWEPGRAAIACALFAAAETAQIRLQGTQMIPSQFVEMIPYLLTIVALAGLVGRSRAPAALGRADG